MSCVVKTLGKGRDFLAESKKSKPKLTFQPCLSSIIRNAEREVLAWWAYLIIYIGVGRVVGQAQGGAVG